MTPDSLEATCSTPVCETVENESLSPSNGGLACTCAICARHRWWSPGTFWQTPHQRFQSLDSNLVQIRRLTWQTYRGEPTYSTVGTHNAVRCAVILPLFTTQSKRGRNERCCVMDLNGYYLSTCSMAGSVFIDLHRRWAPPILATLETGINGSVIAKRVLSHASWPLLPCKSSIISFPAKLAFLGRGRQGTSTPFFCALCHSVASTW